jgi:hypothetical protein
MQIMSDTLSSEEINEDGNRDMFHSAQCEVPFQVPRNTQNLYFGNQRKQSAFYLRHETRTIINIKLHGIALSGLVTVLSTLQVRPWIWFYSVGSYPAAACRHHQSLLSRQDSTFVC